MAKQVGFYEYSVSPFQLNPFKGFFNPGASLFLKRTARQLAVIGPPALFFYYLAGWADHQVCMFNVVGAPSTQRISLQIKVLSFIKIQAILLNSPV
jgi:hypothetical protein